mgnify:CR=1 FL=1
MQVFPVPNARLQLDAEKVCKTENSRALPLCIGVNDIRLDVRGVLLQEVQNVMSFPRPQVVNRLNRVM